MSTPATSVVGRWAGGERRVLRPEREGEQDPPGVDVDDPVDRQALALLELHDEVLGAVREPVVGGDVEPGRAAAAPRRRARPGRCRHGGSGPPSCCHVTRPTMPSGGMLVSCSSALAASSVASSKNPVTGTGWSLHAEQALQGDDHGPVVADADLREPDAATTRRGRRRRRGRPDVEVGRLGHAHHTTRAISTTATTASSGDHPGPLPAAVVAAMRGAPAAAARPSTAASTAARRAEAEQLDVGVAHEQHRRRPLDLVDVAVDRLAGLGHRRRRSGHAARSGSCTAPRRTRSRRGR